MILLPKYDPIGQAVYNYHFKKDNTPIDVCSDIVEDEQLLPDYFFRKIDNMPQLEQIALKLVTGAVLDVGAGAGCHSIYLQNKNIDITALEYSQLCCEVLQNMGIKQIENCDILSFSKSGFDTILLLMNGIGVAGSVSGLKTLLSHLKKLLNNGGKILIDSSDLMYLFEEEDGSFVFDINNPKYYGEIVYTLRYKNIQGNPFSWLFADSVLLTEIAEEVGFSTKIIEYGPHYDYLAELKLTNQ